MMLAMGFSASGHEVCVVTQTPGTQDANLPFRIVRRPNPQALLRLTLWCDVMFHNNISLQAVWPLLLVRRPWVVAHHTWIPKSGGVNGMKGRLKHALLRRARGISISNAIAAHIDAPSTVIPNPYDDNLFRRLGDVEKENDLVFVGRLVSDKGVDVLLRAQHSMGTKGAKIPHLTIIGDGPQESELRQLVAELNLGSNVTFTGRLQGEPLARELNAHGILVVPSRWNEPFGIVALEGIACGCVVVASAGGGLNDAVGPCGLTFPNGDVQALTECLNTLLENPHRVDEMRKHADGHLALHTQKHVVSSYLDVIKSAVKGNNYGPCG
jgi:glycosyltransferase involved in cell wall biosynthesis